jgi:CheY-like chemotaxis protein
VTGDAGASSVRIVILADDLIWSTRLADGVRRAGAEPVPVRAAAALAGSLEAADGCLVDLTARAYDGLAAVRAARDADVPVLAVGQHDDAPLRRAAREAGAARVYAYRALFEQGDRVLGAWIGGLAPRGLAPGGPVRPRGTSGDGA